MLALFHLDNIYITQHIFTPGGCQRPKRIKVEEKMKKTGIGIALLVIGLVAASFFLLNYRYSSSQTTQNSAVASSRSGNSEEQNKLFPPAVTNVVVVGSSRLDASLKANLSDWLPGVAGLGEVHFVKPDSIPAESALLYVQIKEQNVRWTPVYSSAAVQVEVAYAENGDVSFKDTNPVYFQSGTKPGTLQFKGTYQLDDISWGLISLPGYQYYLTQSATATITKSVSDQLKDGFVNPTAK